ncbi:sulfate adenylyltransferase subunit CysN [Agrobacterium rosae]|uniref:sulfate adenylyltransferase subunit CysN n=1 Tax=Agrobacterium rosae TaxID=1972867 RepID=UPI00122F27F4|nr:sulfate adenylyltransferase subunit CysN [Agrobacterium rosae]KAA3507685.1 sulfate adenylyltransferase subunit CysN [Agrobacterium rosae]KAA3512565.1 sulfate adenylyltransferase subunit CysN [Agrobacterium rosae]MQB51270.1 sulfate adenylyltransferase subunit CysN [Agrobacterium rosae]
MNVGKYEEINLSSLKEYQASQDKDLLRFLTCGSVDDGKSTLIGRLLFDTKLISDDQLATAQKDTKRFGTTGDDIDFSLLVDGLQAEREQRITIDVAYRFFATERRKFIVADTPGHEQYTRNMATGASNSDMAIVLIDARKGVMHQTRRHSHIVSQLGIKHVVLAVNKIDLQDYSELVFNEIVLHYRTFSDDLAFQSVTAVPISARFGDNVLLRSENTPWYHGPTLVEHLENVDIERPSATQPLRFPVQLVNRPNADFRGFSGTIASGMVRRGDELIVAASGKQARVQSIVTYDGELHSACAGQAITLTLDEEIDVSRGDILCPPTSRPEVSDQFQATLIWMSEDAMMPGRPMLIKIGAQTTTGSVTEIRYKTDINTFAQLAAKTLQLNEVGLVNIATNVPIAYEPYNTNRKMGAFIIIDRMTNQTIGAGMIEHGLRRATNVHWQATAISREKRARIKSQRPLVLWFTGLSGAGKSTIANLVEQKLWALGHHTYLLDGDNVRQGLNKDLGFTAVDRVENIRRVAEVAKLMTDAGLITLVSLISPFEADRLMARELIGDMEFIEIFVTAPLPVVEQRDSKGLYAKARLGEIKNFTGIDSPYEEPENPELTLDSVEFTSEELAEKVIRLIIDRKITASFVT